MVMEVLHEDTSEGNIQCLNHPFKNSSPGGICAFCLQEKLGKLVSSSSSSFPSTVFPSSGSSSSSPSFRSDNVAIRSSENIAKNRGFNNNNNNNNNGCQQPTRRSRLPFALPHKKNKNQKDVLVMGKMTFPASDSSSSVVFNRSKSTSASSRTGTLFLDDAEDKTPRKRGFWSFLHYSKHPSNRRSVDKLYKDSNFTVTTPSSSVRLSSSVCGVRVKKIEELAVVVDDENSSSPDESERKVSRSRSVGCGSRSFSNDLFERISNGFGDCALRRVESHREGKSRTHTGARKSCVGMIGHDFIKERVRCGGIFSGFMHVSSSSPSSSSSYNSSYVSGKLLSASASHGRSKSWGWAFASPMRAFAKTPSSASGKKNASDNGNNIKNGAPNLSAIPSILAASS